VRCGHQETEETGFWYETNGAGRFNLCFFFHEDNDLSIVGNAGGIEDHHGRPEAILTGSLVQEVFLIGIALPDYKFVTLCKRIVRYRHWRSSSVIDAICFNSCEHERQTYCR
jgi:hypothetical protein